MQLFYMLERIAVFSQKRNIKITLNLYVHQVHVQDFSIYVMK
jgi:hypothetical protein